MRTIIAKTETGRENWFFVKDSFSVRPGKDAKAICKMLNAKGWKLSGCEIWKTYKVDERCLYNMDAKGRWIG